MIVTPLSLLPLRCYGLWIIVDSNEDFIETFPYLPMEDSVKDGAVTKTPVCSLYTGQGSTAGHVYYAQRPFQKGSHVSLTHPLSTSPVFR